MLLRQTGLSTAILALTISSPVQAGWQDLINQTMDQASKSGALDVSKSALSNSEVVAGLKEALANGVESAINTLGKPGGFAGNKLVEITVPDSLKTVTSTVRALGQGEYVDSFELTMNQAAEKAVPEAASILSDAIRQMSIDDAIKILHGPNDSATQYFRKVSEASLEQKFKPIVSQATDQTGVTAAYKNLTSEAAPLLSGVIDESSINLDQYITSKTLDGLFEYISLEEKSIRDNPAARSTELLKKVFAQ